jgi:hypothetical protein
VALQQGTARWVYGQDGHGPCKGKQIAARKILKTLPMPMANRPIATPHSTGLVLGAVRYGSFQAAARMLALRSPDPPCELARTPSPTPCSLLRARLPRCRCRPP